MVQFSRDEMERRRWGHEPIDRLRRVATRCMHGLMVLALLAGCASHSSHVVPPSGASAHPATSGTPTSNSRWRFLGDWPDKTALYVDMQTYDADGRTRGMWLKLVATDGSASVAQALLDCTGRRVRIDTVSAYGPDGSLTESPSEGSHWTSAAPGTLDAELLKLFCPVPG